MPVNSVSSSDLPLYERDTSNDSNGVKVNTETFLKLLVAQLKYQDPLEPQKDTAFVTQMAQMTSLQEMQSMNASMQNSQAYDMIGKEIYAEVYNKDTQETEKYAGIVDSVVIMKGIPYVVVGTQAIAISDVKQVFAPLEDTTPPEDTPPPEDTTTETT
jgi:flagellar basal-body rod modification protein FlgD